MIHTYFTVNNILMQHDENHGRHYALNQLFRLTHISSLFSQKKKTARFHLIQMDIDVQHDRETNYYSIMGEKKEILQ